MKFFTLDWWNGIQVGEEDGDPNEEYEKYYQSIKEKLPEAFQIMREDVFLHDGWLRKFDLTINDSELVMIIDADDGNGNLRVVTLRYDGVEGFSTISKPEQGLAGPMGFGDWGYDEVEYDNNLIKHSILFSSGIELIISFKNLKITYE
jgi:hypothetical protein